MLDFLRTLKRRLRGASERGDNVIRKLVERDPAAWQAARTCAVGGQQILIATNVTGFQHATLVESVLAMALTLRGAEVHFVVCDAALPACLKVEPDRMPDPRQLIDGRIEAMLCRDCQAVGEHHFEPLGLRRWFLSELITAEDRRSAADLCARLGATELSTLTTASGDKVGMHGLAGALRYFARAELPQTDMAVDVLRRFVAAALLTSRAYDRLLAKQRYDAAVFHHGIYVPQGPAGDALRRHGVRVVNWNPSYRRSTFIFSHGDTYHYTLMNEPVSAWDTIPWSAQARQEILDYLESRAVGTRDWIWFHEKPDHDAATVIKELGLDLSRPIVGMLSNVAWDAQLHYPANAFDNMIEWVFKTFDCFARRPELQLLLRIHPAEIRGTVPSRQPLLDEIKARYPTLPSNIFIIAPDSNISTYAAMSLCNSIIIYGTKMGVELTAVGKPVIVAGEAWIRNKGLTSDAASEATYFDLLDRLPVRESMDEAQIERARKYAYHFFFRRMIPLPFIVPTAGKIYGLEIDGLAALAPGRYPGLDVICDGILVNAPFIYPVERLGLHDQ